MKQVLLSLFAIVFAGSLSQPRAQTSPLSNSHLPRATSAKTTKVQWSSLLEEGERAGLIRSRLKSTTDRLSRSGIAPDAGRLIIIAALDAAKQGLPWEPVLAKIDEGILKKVGAEALISAGKSRLDSLARARTLVVAALGTPASRDDKIGLVPSTAFALESGLPEGVLTNVLARGKGKPPAQLRPVVEAGEALQLAGFETDALETLMGDCLARNLRRSEILRVVRFAVEKKRQGLPGMAIRQALWETPGKGEKTPPAEQAKPATAPVSDGQPSKPIN